VKAVLDTNVLVSSLLTPGGTCAQILDLITGRVVRPCLDGRILAEYEDVLPDPRFPFRPDEVDRVLTLFRAAGERVTARPHPIALPHPADLPFIEVAAAGEAVLVTANLRHFPERARCGVTVLSPSGFLELLRRSP
jgi:putative PIN family toxin of toxin-antitoxin system